MSTSDLHSSNGSAVDNSFQLLFEKSADAILLIEDGVFVDCNQTALKMLGYSGKEQLIGQHPWQISPPLQSDGLASREKAERILAEALVEGVSRFEWEHLRADGEVFPVEVSLTVIPRQNKPVLHLVWRDIADRRRAEAELQNSEANYRAIFNASRDVIFVLDMETGAILDANRRACEVNGYSVEEFREKGLSTFISEEPPFDLATAFQYVVRAIEGEPQLFEWLNRTRSGERRWGEVSLTKATIDGRERILSCAHDIVERKHHEELLVRRAEQIKRFQGALVKVAKTASPDLCAALQLITEVDAQALEVARVSVWFFDEGQTQIVCHNLFEATSSRHSQGMTLQATDFPRYFEALQERRAIAASDAMRDPITAEFGPSYLEPMGIVSLLDVPIWRHGRMVGIVCHEHLGMMRQWTPEEQDFAASVADMVSLALESSERQRIERELRVSEARFRTLFEQFPFSIQILSPQGETLQANRAWEELFGLKLADVKGVNLLEDVQLQEQDSLRYLRRGFAGEATAIPESFYDPMQALPFHPAPARSPFWIQAFVFPVKDEAGNISEVILTHQDIDERKQAEAAVQTAHHELQLAHEELEKRVEERTRELADANAALVSENAERLHAEALLRRKTAELEAIFEASPDLYFQLDATGRVLSYHAARASSLYVPPEKFLGLRLQDVLPAPVGEQLKANLDEVIATGGAACLEYDLPIGDKTGNFEARLMPVVDEHVIAIVRDITQRKETEAALRHSEEYFRSLIENALDVITLLDAQGEIRYESPSVQRVTGFAPHELVGTMADEFVHPDDRAAMMEMWVPIIEQPGTTHVGEFRYRHQDGSWLVLECIGTTLSPTSPDQGVVINSRDVTERKNAEATLRQSEALKASILEVALDAIITIDHGGRVVEFNPVAEQIFGFKHCDVVGLEMATLIVPPEFRDAHHQGIRRYLETGEGAALNTRIEVVGMRKDGSRFPMELAVRPIATPGQPMFTSYIRDISEHKAAEEALRQAIEDAETAREAAELANSAKSEFLSRMSHELRTPMNSILGFGQVLARKVEPDQRKSVEHILKAGRHLLGLINEVLDIARIEANKMQISLEPVRVGHIVGETLNLIQPLALERDCSIGNHIAEADDFYVLADRQRLTQVLLNIVSNAVKYTGDSGVVTLSSRSVEGQRLRIEITDTGPGLSIDQMERIFHPFDRLGAEHSHIEGTGLGLALSKGFVEVMGGKIGVDSTVGQGCRFWVEFPIVESPQQRLARTRDGVPLPEPGSGRASTVLHIEDNLANLSLIEAILADRKEISLLSALQGQLGLELAWKHQPDLILLDLHLPDISGDEVLAELRRDARTRNVPVMVISADATQSHIKDVLSGGAQSYLTKPLDIDEFLAQLDGLLEAKAP